MYSTLLLIACLPLAAQTPPTGVVTEWDLQTQLKDLSAGARRLVPIIDQSNPRDWNDVKAGQSYQEQWQAARAAVDDLDGAAQRLAKDPERLTLVLETYLRLESLESSVSAVIEGIRKYRNPAIADLLQAAMADNLTNRDRLKSYLTDLTQTKEQELAIMDREAQRCRAGTSRQPPAPAKPRSKQP